MSDPAEQSNAPVFVLVRPQMGENIGAAARAMLNFRLDRMRLIAPRDGWPNPRATAMASGAASQVLDHAGVFDTVPAALEGCHYVFATTARGRGLAKPVMTPERAMQVARELARQGRRAAVLFGPERAGLDSDDVARADAIVTVPVNPDFYSLNLAQCVLLMAYEWGRQTSDVPPEVMAMAGTDFATATEVSALGDRAEAALTEAGFFHPPDKAPHMKRSLRSMWGRLALTRTDVQTLHGVLRQLVRGHRGG